MFKSLDTRINVYLNNGGLGDRIATVPAILYCLNQYHHMSCDIIAPDYIVELLRHFLRGYEKRAQVVPMSRAHLVIDQDLPAVVMKNNYVTTLRRHLVDFGFDIINDTSDVPVEAKNYPKVRLDEVGTVHLSVPAPYKYVCLTPAFTAPVRELPAETWNEIARWLIGKHFIPVWLGSQENTVGGPLSPESKFTCGVDYSLGYDYRDKTSLLGAAKIMALSSAVVGLDNGLIHLAATTDVPIVAGYSSVDPETRLPYRDGILGKGVRVVVPEETLECRFFQSNTHFNYSADFRHCQCGTFDCVNQLTPEKFINELELVLK